MRLPTDSPAWLKAVVEELDEDANRSMKTEEPARAVGFFMAVDKLKRLIDEHAEAEEQRRKKELHELTYPATN